MISFIFITSEIKFNNLSKNNEKTFYEADTTVQLHLCIYKLHNNISHNLKYIFLTYNILIMPSAPSAFPSSFSPPFSYPPMPLFSLIKKHTYF